jgi:hypothetical protein
MLQSSRECDLFPKVSREVHASDIFIHIRDFLDFLPRHIRRAIVDEEDLIIILSSEWLYDLLYRPSNMRNIFLFAICGDDEGNEWFHRRWMRLYDEIILY